MMFSAFVWGLLLLPSSIASVLQVVEKIDSVPRDWYLVREAKNDDIVKLRVSLRHQNVEYFEQLIMLISTPGHAKYGQHLKKDEVADILRPSTEACSSVLNWLKENNVQGYHRDGDWVDFWTTVGNANAMFDTEFNWFRNDIEQQERLRTLQYSMPIDVFQHINFVEPTIKFPSLRKMRSTIHSKSSSAASNAALSNFMEWKLESGSGSTVAPPDAICAETITPQCLLKLYNIHYPADATNGNKVSYASFLDEYARYTDLTIFEDTQAMYAEGESFSVVQFAGGLNDQTSTNDSTEANLDNQYILSVSYPTPVTEYSTAGCGPLTPDPNEPAGACDNEPYIDFLNGILALSDSELPQTLSVSYGDDEQTWPYAMASTVCTMFAQLGARGVSVMFASGDSGPGAICENNAGTVLKFVPAFPASCPWVTAVGATQSVGPEEAASFSGGGFSNYFGRPSYQSSAVATYLKSIGTLQSAYYNASGRGYPDVSAQGVDYLVVNDGVTEPVDGTSCSSPTFAAVIALLNSARISAGLSPLGFLNPFLYSSGIAGLNDITLGGSVGCDGNSGTIPYAGWNATAGWDPVTGLGTPDFGKLLAIVAPEECNIGGVLANPTSSVCSPYISSSTATSTTPSTPTSTSTSSKSTTTTTSSSSSSTSSKKTTTTTTTVSSTSSSKTTTSTTTTTTSTTSTKTSTSSTSSPKTTTTTSSSSTSKPTTTTTTSSSSTPKTTTTTTTTKSSSSSSSSKPTTTTTSSSSSSTKVTTTLATTTTKATTTTTKSTTTTTTPKTTTTTTTSKCTTTTK